ncbi:MAG: zonular occludens toxin domain-containing protein [Cyanobacteria bacterium P01_D01_bin.6]
MAIYGIYGEIGSGKSWYQMHFGLRLANRTNKRIVTNFGINLKALKLYAQLCNLPWIIWLCDNNQISVVDTKENDNLSALFEGRSESVVMLDEAGIFLNAREFMKTPKQLLMDLAQSRKDANDLLYSAQVDIQVDKQFKMLTQYFIHAEGMTKRFDKKLRMPKLYYKRYYHFRAAAYWAWVGNFQVRASALRSWFKADFMTAGPMTKKDYFLFKCFKSKARLEQQQSFVMEAQNVSPWKSEEKCLSTASKASKYRQRLISMSFYDAAARLPLKEFLRWQKIQSQKT